MTILFPDGMPPAAYETLRESNFTLESFLGSKVPRLEQDTTDQVCVITETCLRSAQWPRLRVQLARANRPFLVELQEETTGTIVRAMREGAYDVVSATAPRGPWEVAHKEARKRQQLWLDVYGPSLATTTRFSGRSQRISDLRRDLERLTMTRCNVLLTGESGVGKNFAANLFRPQGEGASMVTVNCSSPDAKAIEAQLFQTAVDEAENSEPLGTFSTTPPKRTLVLDELGDLSPGIQATLLDFLDQQERKMAPPVRLIALSSHDLEVSLKNGVIRPALYYRVAEFTFTVPALRERVEDIPDLVNAFLPESNERHGKNFDTIEPELVTELQRHRWPGNVRELRNVIDRMVLFYDGTVLRKGWWETPPNNGLNSFRRVQRRM